MVEDEKKLKELLEKMSAEEIHKLLIYAMVLKQSKQK